MGPATLLGAAATLFSSVLSKPPALAATTPDKDNRPDETSTGIAEARKKRRALAARTGRTGLRSPDVDDEGQARGGLTIQT